MKTRLDIGEKDCVNRIDEHGVERLCIVIGEYHVAVNDFIEKVEQYEKQGYRLEHAFNYRGDLWAYFKRGSKRQKMEETPKWVT